MHYEQLGMLFVMGEDALFVLHVQLVGRHQSAVTTASAPNLYSSCYLSINMDVCLHNCLHVFHHCLNFSNVPIP